MSDVIRIDKDRALQLLREVVQGREDFVYEAPPDGSDRPRCVYADGDCPSCVVGHAMSWAGATPEQVRQMDEAKDGGIDLLKVPWLDLNDEARAVFFAAQQLQDNGKTWGAALAAAEAVAS